MTSSTLPGERPAPAGDSLVPNGWLAIEGLVFGFGDRTVSAPSGTLLLRRQVHGKDILDAAGEAVRLVPDPGDDFPRVDVDADALIAASPGTVVGVRTADCVPLLLVAPRARWSAAVHAGWRGTVAGIATEAVRAAREAGIRPHELLASLGPSIGPCCYEVSEELGVEFEHAGLPVQRPSYPSQRPSERPVGVLQRPAGSSERPVGLSQRPVGSPERPAGLGAKPHLDLRAANRLLLERSGVPARNVQVVGACTRCARDRYHSFRAEPESAGRQVSWIGWA